MGCAPVRRVIDRTGAQTMLYLTCTTIPSVDLAHYIVSHAKDWVCVDYGTMRPLYISVYNHTDQTVNLVRHTIL